MTAAERLKYNHNQYIFKSWLIVDDREKANIWMRDRMSDAAHKMLKAFGAQEHHMKIIRENKK